MENLQIKNLFICYFLYNGCDRSCDLPIHSPDYLMEKWNSFIGVEGNKTEYPELQDIPLYKDWAKIWVRNGKNIIPDNIMMFLIKTHPKGNDGRYCRLSKLIDLFEKYIGSPYNINTNEPKNVHPLFMKSIEKIIKQTITKDELRDFTLGSLLLAD
jgi:hypothetical protein